MWKKVLLCAMAAMLVVPAFARTKKEVMAEITSVSRIFWGFPYNKAFVAYEKEVLLKDKDYAELVEKKKEQEKKVREYLWSNISGFEGGKEAVERCRKAYAALEASPDDSGLRRECNIADAAMNKIAAANKFSAWAGEGGAIMTGDRELHFKRYDRAAELMVAGDNEEMKTLGKNYLDARAKEKALREEYKTAE